MSASRRRAAVVLLFAVAVTLALSPRELPAQGAFALTRAELVFVNRRPDITVPLRYPNLRAYAMLRFTGVGILRATWKVDGRMLGTVVHPTMFGEDAILVSPELPTVEPGQHRVTLDVDAPRPAFKMPEITYFVTAEDYEEWRKKRSSRAGSLTTDPRR
jgi:hypothetical protein